MFVYKLLTGRNIITHQESGDLGGHAGILDFHPLQDAGLGIERRLPQLLEAHLTKTLIALDLCFA